MKRIEAKKRVDVDLKMGKWVPVIKVEDVAGSMQS